MFSKQYICSLKILIDGDCCCDDRAMTIGIDAANYRCCKRELSFCIARERGSWRCGNDESRIRQAGTRKALCAPVPCERASRAHDTQDAAI
jgi:hypothetical protein